MSNCKRNLSRLFLASVVASTASQAYAERIDLGDGYSLGGSLRVRYERQENMSFTKSRDDFFLHQIRLNLKKQFTPEFSAYVEGQDAGITGENGSKDSAVPNVFSDSFDLHQGYFNYSPTSYLNIKVGRQKLNFGNQRLSSSLEWVNAPRSWDAVRVTLGKEGWRTLDSFASKPVAVDPNGFNGHTETGNRYFDSGFYGVYYSDWKTLKYTQFDLYGFWRDEDEINDSVITLGGRFETEIDYNWSVDGEFAYQFGDFGSEDHSAFALHAGAKYKFEYLTKHTASVNFNYASGDKDAADTDHETFDNLYPLNHAYYGFADRFSLMNMKEINIKLASKINKSILGVAYHFFWLNEAQDDSWYAAANFSGTPLFSHVNATPATDDEAGSEIDITLKTQHTDKISSLIGYSHFFGGNYVDQMVGTGATDADYYYAMVKLNF